VRPARGRARRGGWSAATAERAEDARAGLRVGERAVRRLDLDAEGVREAREPALAHQRGEAAREGDRAEHRRIGPRQARALERLREDPAVEGGVVGDEHPGRRRSDELGQVRQRRLGGRSAVDHLLCDPGEALDRARQRRSAADERLPAVVQLAAADEHGTDLGELAGLARAPVGLGVDDEELGRRQRCSQQVHRPRAWRERPTACRAGCSFGHTPTVGRGSLEAMLSVVERGTS
jgi:hypothetical protein